MANRHKAQCRASGGRAVYQGASSNVAKEATEMKRGGKAVGKMAGNKGKGRFARGGCVSSPFSSAGGGRASKHPFAQ
jgi:hypothetical protein